MTEHHSHTGSYFCESCGARLVSDDADDTVYVTAEGPEHAALRELIRRADALSGVLRDRPGPYQRPHLKDELKEIWRAVAFLARRELGE